MDNFECFESHEGPSLRVTLDITCELIFCLSCSLSYKNFPVTSIIRWVFVCELLVFVGMIIKVEFLMLHRERRWQMNFCFCWSPTQLGSMIFSHEETTFTLLFFVFKMTEFDQAGKLRDFLEMLLIWDKARCWCFVPPASFIGLLHTLQLHVAQSMKQSLLNA